jgi:hypothetical protein
MSYRKDDLPEIIALEAGKRHGRLVLARSIQKVLHPALMEAGRERTEMTKEEIEIRHIVDQIIALAGAVMEDGDLLDLLNIKGIVPDDDTLSYISEYSEKGWHLVMAGPARSKEFGPEKQDELEVRYGKENVAMRMKGGFAAEGKAAPLTLFFVKESVLEEQT